MTVRKELIDELLADRTAASVVRGDGFLGKLKRAPLNRMMAV